MEFQRNNERDYLFAVRRGLIDLIYPEEKKTRIESHAITRTLSFTRAEYDTLVGLIDKEITPYKGRKEHLGIDYIKPGASRALVSLYNKFKD